jgi:hypothetical protein
MKIHKKLFSCIPPVVRTTVKVLSYTSGVCIHSKKSMKHLKISGAKRVTCSKFHTQNAWVSRGTIQNLTWGNMVSIICASLIYMNFFKTMNVKNTQFLKIQNKNSTTVPHCSKHISSTWSLRTFPPYITFCNHKLGLFHITVMTAVLLK